MRCQRFQMNEETRVLVQHDDITERTSTERRLNDAQRRLAYHTATDGLTGLANRASFDRARVRMEATRSWPSSVSVILLDIDFFKLFNEMRGHEAGDAALRMLGEASAETLRRPAIWPRVWRRGARRDSAKRRRSRRGTNRQRDSIAG